MIMATLTTLNDDCLWDILSYCDLMTQLNFSKVCQRLKSVVQDLYEIKYKMLRLDCISKDEDWQEQICIEINGERCDMSVEELEYFIELVHEHAKEFCINKVPRIFVNPTKRYIFPNAQMLSFQSYNKVHLQSLQEIHECFPNLRSLKLEGFFNLKSSTKWQCLESLDVTYCIGVESDTFLDMISLYELKKLRTGSLFGPLPTINGDLKYLNKLEALHVNSKESKIFLHALSHMKSLTELFILDFKNPENILQINRTLSELEDRHVIELTVSKFFEYLTEPNYLRELAEQVQKFKHLRKLAIVGYHAGFSKILNPTSFPALEELVFYLSHTSIEFMVNSMKDAPQLNTIEFIDCYNESETTVIDVESVTRSRTKHLNINVHNLKDDADFMPAEIRLNGKSDMITLTENAPINLPLRYVAMQYVIEQVK